MNPNLETVRKGRKQRTMNHNKFDNEYYVMEADNAYNHPVLTFGDTNCRPFMKKMPLDNDEIELPIKIEFDDDYPEYEMADLLILDAQYAVSEKLKNILEREEVHGIQFFPAEIETEKSEIILGHNFMHVWNRLAAIDKKNYKGGKPDELGLILDLESISLNEDLMEKTPFEQRKVIRLAEDPSMLLVHQSIYNAIKEEGLTGMSFWKVSEWDTGAMFRKL